MSIKHRHEDGFRAPDRKRPSRLQRFLRRNRTTIAVAVAVALSSSGTAMAATALFIAQTNTASTTTTLKSAVNGAVFSIQNTNTTGGTSARGLAITVPSGRPPITVSSTAGKATNLNADKLDGIDSTSFFKGPVAAWREVGASGQPNFLPWCDGPDCIQMWTNYGPNHNTVAFYKDPLGMVHLKGLVAVTNISIGGGVGCDELPIFNLPAGYRPARITILPTCFSAAHNRMDVLPNGNVVPCPPFDIAYDPGNWWSLDGISFRAAQ